MSVCGQDFIDFAEKCVTFKDEIGFRNAVGRAYYGVYHEICDKLEHCLVLDSHKGVREYLMNRTLCKNEPFDKMKLRSIGAILQQMHTKRKWADYELNRTMNQPDAEAAIIAAKKVMGKIKDMHEETYPPKPAV